jgi:drug/metabolite transporter (DMT)-like permease
VRPRVIVGVALIVLGLFVVFRGISYSSDRQVMKVGDIEARVEEKHSIPAWLGVVAIVGGVALLAAGQASSSMSGPDPHTSRPW